VLHCKNELIGDIYMYIDRGNTIILYTLKGVGKCCVVNSKIKFEDMLENVVINAFSVGGHIDYDLVIRHLVAAEVKIEDDERDNIVKFINFSYEEPVIMKAYKY